jgi:hypothetical protein
MALQQEIARLYALPAQEFIQARDAAARAATDSNLADALRSLRKPSKAAWLANLLAREDPAGATALVELGAQLRKAQQDLDGARMRTLSKQRRELIQELRRKVDALGNETISDSIGRQLEDIFQAALADPGAGAAFTGARISGLPDSADVDPFAGIPSGRPKKQPKKQQQAQPERTPANEQGELRAARAAEREAADAARKAQAAAKKVRSRVLDRTSALQDLENEITRTRSELSGLRKELRAAEHSAELAERKLDEARARFAKISGG